MQEEIKNQTINMSRRFTLKAFSMLPLLGYGLMSLYDEATAAGSLACTLAPTLTEGPYWVDEKLNRSDITTGTTRSSVLNGLPLTLAINIFNSNGDSCGVDPMPNVQIDIWHADAAGEYSDASGNGQSNTKRQTFLRGYQVTDANGTVNFKTIYPGWYGGRTTHIHLRARAYDANGNVTYNFTTQLFFDDTLSDSVYAGSPYNSRATRDTRNTNDSIYKTGTPVLVTLTANPAGGYAGEVAIGLSNLPASLLTDSFSVATTAGGTTLFPTLTGIVKIASQDIGSAGSIYVAAEVANSWYFNNGANWIVYTADLGNNFPAFYTGLLSSSHNLNMLSGVDVSGLKGTNFYVGYGQNAQDMLQKSQYRKTYTIT